MSEDLSNELEAINSIYGPDTLISASSTDNDLKINGSLNSYVLSLPNQPIAIRLCFPQDYPLSPPTVVGTHHVGGDISKGSGTEVVGVVREILAKVFRVGEVCLFDLLEELGSSLEDGFGIENRETGHAAANDVTEEEDAVLNDISPHSDRHLVSTGVATDHHDLGASPAWTISEVVTEKKSVFIARAAPVSSPAQAEEYIHHLISTDKKVARATHNITAWRIEGEGNATFQDCDDDRETAAGSRLLHLMQVMDIWNVMVVVTRWYGGVQLGPDRFRIINSVARDAFVRGSFVKGEEDKASGGRKKGKK